MENNIQAFPKPNFTYQEESIQHIEFHEDGMTLLDYFAAKAMQGWLSSQPIGGVQPFTTIKLHEQAELAYNLASAMLEERKNYIK